MVYLLQDTLKPSNYLLMERTDDAELLYTTGAWSYEIPTTFDIITHEAVEYKNGKPINWWTKAYPDYADATILVRRKTREGYLKWVSEHPELFI